MTLGHLCILHENLRYCILSEMKLLAGLFSVLTRHFYQPRKKQVLTFSDHESSMWKFPKENPRWLKAFRTDNLTKRSVGCPWKADHQLFARVTADRWLSWLCIEMSRGRSRVRLRPDQHSGHSLFPAPRYSRERKDLRVKSERGLGSRRGKTKGIISRLLYLFPRASRWCFLFRTEF